MFVPRKLTFLKFYKWGVPIGTEHTLCTVNRLAGRIMPLSRPAFLDRVDLAHWTNISIYFIINIMI